MEGGGYKTKKRPKKEDKGTSSGTLQVLGRTELQGYINHFSAGIPEKGATYPYAPRLLEY